MHSTAIRPALCALLTLAAGLSVFSGCQAADRQSGKGDVLATVEGKPITEADVKAASAEQFQAFEREYAQKRYDLLKAGLDRLVEDRLVTAEAAARGISEEDLLATMDTKPVTDADVDRFYQENQARIRGTKEQMAPQIREYLEQLNQDRARKVFMADLREKHKVDYRLDPLRIQVAATGPAKGPANAPVTIVEFADFQCPYCVRIKPALDQVLETYGDRVRLVYRQFPLTAIHENAERAAEASLCAQDQGKFWEMHDAMFANQHLLEADQLKATAASLGMNAEQFDECLDSGQYKDAVAADAEAGNAAGVSGTPALFVNGRFLNGAVPVDQITELVDDELRRKGIKTAGD